jgi:hypothetical protein
MNKKLQNKALKEFPKSIYLGLDKEDIKKNDDLLSLTFKIVPLDGVSIKYVREDQNNIIENFVAGMMFYKNNQTEDPEKIVEEWAKINNITFEEDLKKKTPKKKNSQKRTKN